MITRNLLLAIFTLIVLATVVQCVPEPKETEGEQGEELSGGSATIFDESSNAFSFQIANLTKEEGLNFFSGNSLFNQNWVSAPASTTARDGLGPLFNARSCSGCHFKDGRGRPPEFIGERAHGLLIRISADNDPIYGPVGDPHYGGQLQDLSIQGVNREADFLIEYENIYGSYPDGSPYSLRKPTIKVTSLMEGDLTATHFSPRIANQMVGMGLLEAISEETLLELEDEHDLDGDGISGKANYVWNFETQSTSIGRFGWKANQPSVKQQVAAAFSGDLGITSSLFPESNCPPSIDCETFPNGGDPEITDRNLDKVTLYSSVLAVPGRRDWKNEDVIKGKEIFNDLNCSSCHIPKIQTSEHPTITALSNQTIRPYTDLLLHDMGEGLADNSDDFLANGKEWRTPPLWGIGLFHIVNGHTYYLHDGRARSIEEAILWHDGEAADSKNKFVELSKKERTQLIQFLNSL